jgi:protein-disulfide isomerase
MQSRVVATLAVPVSDARDHIQGLPNAAVTLVEYGDYECPHCGEAHPIIKRIQEQVGEALRFVYRHFPLTLMHAHAESAAEASEAAGAQGKFWEMHDLLFDHQDSLDKASLLRLAAQLKIDQTRFAYDLKEGKFQEKVREDITGGVKSGVNGTPTFFINDVRHDGPWDLQSLMSAIERSAEY